MTNNTNRKRILFFSMALMLYTTSFSQEVLTDLTINQALSIKYHERKIANLLSKQPLYPHDTLPLPFLDDFSKDGIYPDASLWLDSNVFINRDYPIAPPTLGVATFDGVSKSGCPYDTNLTNATISKPADTLTSKPINLSLLPLDSVYLTFFWQAKGKGNTPENNDTLLLDFFNPTTNTWKNIWYKNGYNPSGTDTIFRLVSLPITDTVYLKNAFQFRFRNTATVSGNVDHWHVDYVLLDKNRNKGDTIFEDVAFVYNAKSLLKNYYAMPWNQYQASEMKTNLDFFIRNNDIVIKNTAFDYKIYDHTNTTQASYTGGSDNCNPYITSGYWNYARISNPQIGTNVPSPMTLIPYSYPTLTDSASFTIESALGTTLNDKNKWNDTLRFKQNFYNYYAYDDGTAEAGYGLKNFFGAQIAYKFTLNVPDTLVGLQMLFNWIPPKVSYLRFKLRIWNDANGSPGSIVYEDDSLFTPHYQYQHYNNWGNLTNAFYPYKFKIPQKLNGAFYVGWVQYTDEILSIGYDKNTSSGDKMFYNVGSGWNKTSLSEKGSWMIRAVFGDMPDIVSVNEQASKLSAFSVYPNPTSGEFNIESKISDIRWQKVTIYNIFGENIFDSKTQQLNGSPIDISHAPNGIYFLRITDEKGITQSQKLILSK